MFISVNKLKLVLKKQNKYEETKTMHRRNLENSEKIFGPKYSDMFINMNNFAYTFKTQNRNDETISLMKKYFHLRKRILNFQYLYIKSLFKTLNK